MHLEMFKKYLEGKFELVVDEEINGYVKTGLLVQKLGRSLSFPIRNFIPRFQTEDYVDNFGYQWTHYKSLQLDSKNGRSHSHDRVKSGTKWPLDGLSGKSVLDCGSGAGRFTEIFLQLGADVISVEMSEAADVALENCGLKRNLLVIQSDINNMPFFDKSFDYVFCFGVLQHTPNPQKTLYNIFNYVKFGGRISVDIYRKRFLPTSWSTPKYIWRPIVKRLKKEKLLRLIQWYVPKYIKFDTIIKKIPRFGYVIGGIIPIPCWNYLNSGYTDQERIQHAIMDTFDALSPVYDKPATKRQVNWWFKKLPCSSYEVFYGGNGVIGNAVRNNC